MAEAGVAVVVGVGPGLGWSLVRRFAQAGLTIAMAARNEARLKRLLAGEKRLPAHAYGCDAADPAQATKLFERVAAELGTPELVVFNAGVYRPGGVLEIAPEDFERCWRVGCFAGFLVGQAAARAMLAQGRGTILFTGATAALRGSAGFANLAVPKFGLRALAQSMARELGPKGLHVAHIVIDGQIAAEGRPAGERGPDSRLDPDAIAESYWQLHCQPRSAWTLELDLRPWVERF